MEDVFREAGYHTKETHLLDVNLGSCTKRPSHEHDKGLGDISRKLHEIYESFLVMEVDDVDIRI